MPDDPRILLIRPSALGDVLRTVPVATSIRRAFPTATLDWVVQDAFTDAIRGHPEVDRVIPFPRHELSGWWRSGRVARQAWKFFASLDGDYDLALDLQGLGRSGLMLRASRAGRRIGFSNAREFGWVGANERYDVPRDLHAVDRMLALLKAAGIESHHDMRLKVPEDCEDPWRHLQSRYDLSDYVVFAPTSRWRTKEWPSERWRALATRMLDSGVRRIALIGSPGEKVVLEGIASIAPHRIAVLAGEASVGMSMAAVREAQLLVANDSAMLHAAVGLATPMVGLFGPTDPKVTGPYGHLQDTIRKPEAVTDGAHYRDSGLDDRLMRLIGVEEVLFMAMERLGGTAEFSE